MASIRRFWIFAFSRAAAIESAVAGPKSLGLLLEAWVSRDSATAPPVASMTKAASMTISSVSVAAGDAWMIAPETAAHCLRVCAAWIFEKEMTRVSSLFCCDSATASDLPA
ncbi:hypothetical protein ACFVT5_37800 [Streptomyces sp. NPDC058001]|uniref:hypothetical protein n=1 Tax=Streptomyces sp. NPDC058001 TaxID=3346300 RepID=UPI0036E03C24